MRGDNRWRAEDSTRRDIEGVLIMTRYFTAIESQIANDGLQWMPGRFSDSPIQHRFITTRAIRAVESSAKVSPRGCSYVAGTAFRDL